MVENKYTIRGTSSVVKKNFRQIELQDIEETLGIHVNINDLKRVETLSKDRFREDKAYSDEPVKDGDLLYVERAVFADFEIDWYVIEGETGEGINYGSWTAVLQDQLEDMVEPY